MRVVVLLQATTTVVHIMGTTAHIMGTTAHIMGTIAMPLVSAIVAIP